MDIRKTSQWVLLLVLGLAFTGCASSELPANTNTTTNSNDNLGLISSCPEGMKAFSDAFVYFCYPEILEVDVDDKRYFIYDPTQGDTLIRELALGRYDEPTLQEHLTSTYVNSSAGDRGITCDFVIDKQANGQWYSIIGYPTGDQGGQDLESVEICRDTRAHANALEELPAEAFFESTTPNGYYLILNGEQDVLFGELNAAFLDSIRLNSNILQ